MVALKAAEIDSFVAHPDAARPIVLLFGPDAGLVRERTEAIINASVDDPRDPFALARLDGDELASEPSRLIEEALTVPLFGGKRAILVKAAGRNFASAVETLIAEPPKDCRVVIEAGDLRRNAPLRNICERAKCAVVIPCYADGERDLMRLIDAEMRATKLTIAPDARAALVALIGGDRRASRNEIKKLTLYAHGQDRVTLDDVVAVVADASSLAFDAVVDATFAGRTADAETQFTKATAAGTSPSTIASTALRHAMQLHKARLSFDEGGGPDAALGSFIPPIHFRRKPLAEAALTAWTTPRLARTINQLADVTLQTRRQPALADAIVERALLSIAQSARRKD